MSRGKGIQKYGISFPENMDDLAIELYCYSITRGNYGKTYCIKNNIDISDFKLLTTYEHFLNAVKLQWPTEVVLQSRGYTNTQILRTLEELCMNDDTVLAGAASMGKCLGKGTPIRMFSGEIKPVENVKAGDIICGDDLTPRKVLSTTSGKSKLYRINPMRGESWVCNDSHILSLKVGYNKKCGSGKWSQKWKKGEIIDIPIQDYLSLSNDKKRRLLQFSVLRDCTATSFEVEDIGEGEYFGFSVDGNHRFLLGDGVVTHNSYPVGLWVYLDWCSAPHCTSSWVATTTLGASEDRIWGIISKLYKSAAQKYGNLIDYRHMIVWGGGTGDEEKDYRNAIKALAFQSGNEGQKAIDTTRGRKNDRIRLALDELPEMEMGSLTARVNLSSNNDAVFIGIGNPSAGDNPHARWCMPKGQSNFDTVNPDLMKWNTETGVCLFYNGCKSPNFDAPPDEPPPFPFLMDRKKQAEMLKQCYGDENAIDYVRNAIGWWPKSGFVQTILTADLIRNADTLNEPLWDSEGMIKIAGFDTAFTAGGDRCVLTIAKLGYVRGTKNKVLHLVDQHVIQLSAREASEFEVQLATEVVNYCRAAGVQPQKFGMDVSGDGGRVGQAIIREWLRYDSNGHSIALISSMGKPTDRIAADVDKRPCNEVYDRLISEYWYSAYHGFKSRVIYGIDPTSELSRELCLRRYKTKNKKISVETKDDYKSRTGFSPDLSDSFLYALEMSRRNGLVFIGNDKVVPTNRFWAKEEKKLESFSDDDSYSVDDNGDW